MPSSNLKTDTPTREELEAQVKQLIMLSIGLKFEEKDALLQRLPKLTDDQLNQLKKVFDEENQRKEQMLSDFFAKHPELFPEFERFSKNHINSIYRGVEDEEKAGEEKRSEELLSFTF